jgi:hypothetical protein
MSGIVRMNASSAAYNSPIAWQPSTVDRAATPEHTHQSDFDDLNQSLAVMAVLVTAIHVILRRKKVVDDRNKSGHDGELCVNRPKPAIVMLAQRQPVQHFQAPPDKICADRNGERDLGQLYDPFTFRHRGSR